MDGSFCNQVLAQIHLFKEKFPQKNNNIYVKKLPRKLDEEVAALMVEGFGGQLTKMTDEQYNYIGLKKEDPMKLDDYNY